MSGVGAVARLEIHFVDSSGVINRNFTGDVPDFTEQGAYACRILAEPLRLHDAANTH